MTLEYWAYGTALDRPEYVRRTPGVADLRLDAQERLEAFRALYYLDRLAYYAKECRQTGGPVGHAGAAVHNVLAELKLLPEEP